jgi:hypothetical protein
MMRSGLLTAVLLVGWAGTVAPAGAQAPSANQQPQITVPFPHSRTGNLTSQPTLEISGLSNGVAVVGAGGRAFGLCWRGGTPPYDVQLTDSMGGVLVHETGVSTTQFVSAGLITFAQGEYKLSVQDRWGGATGGRFTVVPASGLPANVTAAESSHDADFKSRFSGVDLVRYSYELFLANAPLLASADPAGKLTASFLCHSRK